MDQYTEMIERYEAEFGGIFMESFYKYVGELDEEVFQETRRMAGEAVRIFHITDLDDGRKLLRR